MAAREDIVIDKDTLLCSICLETFTLPRTLPCLHSFCHLCLEEYINVSVKTITVQGFDCPVCRTFTPAPVRGIPEHEWTGRFPQNFTLVSILDSSKIGSVEMDRLEQLCDPCRREQIEVVATSYCVECQEKMCADCQRHHRKNKASSKHALRNIHESESEGNVKVLDFMQSVLKCPKHPLKKIKYVCEDHYELCCSDCTTFVHKRCEHVVSITEKAQVSASDGAIMTDRMKELELHAELLLDGERKQLTALDGASDKTMVILSEVKKKMLDTFEELSEITLEKMQSQHKEISAKTLDNIGEIETLKQKIKLFKKKLDNIMAGGNEGHIYLFVMQLKKDLSELSGDMRRLQKSLKCEDMCVDVQKELPEILNWVSIRRQTSESQVPSPPCYRPGSERHAILKRHVAPPFSYTRSCVWQNDNRIIVCDYHACQIATFNAAGSVCLNISKCSSPLGSMVKLDASQMAVSCPDNCTILIMDMNQEASSSVKEIKTPSQPWGLAYNSIDKHLLVQSRNDGTITFFGLDGMHVGSVPLTGSAKTAVQTTYNLVFNSKIKVCYLSCFDVNKVMAINLQGHILFEYSHTTLQAPLGICLGPDDDIYVCSPHGNSIHQLSPSGQLLRELFTGDDNGNDGVTNPWTIGFNDRKDQFIVACSGDTPIRVYDFV